ncbi:MAG: hypothetical protein NT027_06665 [Proteobacteria bacterium]|nr:hypothetical protein [Pseudomonadota bacterium]
MSLPHEGCLLELTCEWVPFSDTQCRYIEFSDLSASVKQELIELDAQGSPYQILHDHLLKNWTYVSEWGRDASEHKARYESLIRDHGHMLTKMATQKLIVA